MRYCQVAISQGGLRVFYVTQNDILLTTETKYKVDYDFNERLIMTQDQIDWLKDGQFRRVTKVIPIKGESGNAHS